jgi:hypothetical protein
MSQVLTSTTAIGASNVAVDRADALLGSAYSGHWYCKWEPNGTPLDIDVTHPLGHVVRFDLIYADRSHEREELTFSTSRHTWSVVGNFPEDAANSLSYTMHDRRNPDDDADGLMFEGSVQNHRDGAPHGDALPLRETFYLAGDTWYHWRFVKESGSWRPYGRRACGRDRPPDV